MCICSPTLQESCEVWKPVVGFEDYYHVSDLGRVKRVKAVPGTRAGKILKPYPQNGYPSITLAIDGVDHLVYIHHLVCQTFIGPIPAGMHVHHKNGIKTDNRPCNLELLTPTFHLRQHAGSVFTGGVWWKVCRKCGQQLPHDAFYERKGGGRAWICRPCDRLRAAVYRRKQRTPK